MDQLNTELFKRNVADDQLGPPEAEVTNDDDDDFSQAFGDETTRGLLTLASSIAASDTCYTQ